MDLDVVFIHTVWPSTQWAYGSPLCVPLVSILGLLLQPVAATHESAGNLAWGAGSGRSRTLGGTGVYLSKEEEGKEVPGFSILTPQKTFWGPGRPQAASLWSIKDLLRPWKLGPKQEKNCGMERVMVPLGHLPPQVCQRSLVILNPVCIRTSMYIS